MESLLENLNEIKIEENISCEAMVEEKNEEIPQVEKNINNKIQFIKVKSFLNCRKNPSMNAVVVRVLDKGEVHKLIRQDGEWGKIKEGWIKLKFVEIKEN